MSSPRIYCAVAQPIDGGVPVTAITTVHKDDYDALAEAVCDAIDAMYADSYVAPDVETARRARERLHAAIGRMQELADYEPRRPPEKGQPRNGEMRQEES